MVESHRETPAIQIAGKIQKMHFQMGAAVTGNAGAHADIGDARLNHTIDFAAHQVNPGQRHLAPLELDVGSGRIELAAELLPVQHPPGDAKRPAEQGFSQFEIAIGQRLAHARAADPAAEHFDGGRGIDAEAVTLAGGLEKFEIPGTVAAEAEIVADLQILHPQAVDQHTLDELGGRQLAQAAVEGQAQHHVDAFGGQQGELVTQTGQARRSSVRTEELTRLRLEDHHATGHGQFRGTLAQARQDGLVPTMNAVEITDGDHTAPRLGLQVMKTSNQLHSTLLVHKVADYTHSRPCTTGIAIRETATRPAGQNRADGSPI